MKQTASKAFFDVITTSVSIVSSNTIQFQEYKLVKACCMSQHRGGKWDAANQPMQNSFCCIVYTDITVLFINSEQVTVQRSSIHLFCLHGSRLSQAHYITPPLKPKLMPTKVPFPPHFFAINFVIEWLQLTIQYMSILWHVNYLVCLFLTPKQWKRAKKGAKYHE